MSIDSRENLFVTRRKGYTSVPNKIMSDRRLTIEARGMLALLMTFKDGWVFRPKHLMEECGVGRDKYYRMINELKEVGYVSVVVTRDQSGSFLGQHWEIIDEPDDHPFPEKPDTAKPTYGKQGHIRENNPLRKKYNKKDGIEKDQDLFPDLPSSEQTDPELEAIESGFEEFWNKIWPKHKRKAQKKDCRDLYVKTCQGKFDKADKVSPTTLNRATRAYVAAERQNHNLQYLKAPLAWLRMPGWEPFLDQEEELSPARRRLQEIIRENEGLA